jgi:hypothetical protein
VLRFPFFQDLWNRISVRHTPGAGGDDAAELASFENHEASVDREADFMGFHRSIRDRKNLSVAFFVR